MSIKTELQAALAYVNTKLVEKGGESASTVYGIGEKIENLSVSGNIIDNPSNFYDETGQTVRTLASLRNANTLFIAFITDSHIYTSNNNKQYFDAQMASLKAVCSAIKPDLVVHGGDITNGSEAKTTTVGYMKDAVKQLREIGGDNTLILVGNHDGNTVQSSSIPAADVESDYRITEAEMETLLKGWNDGFTYAGDNYTGCQFYGYKDYAALGIRVIRLHSYIENIGGGTSYFGGNGGNWGYYDDEVTWFRDVALNTDNDILILSHQTLSPILQGYAENQNIPKNGTAIQALIDNWQTNARHCIGVIHGHVHWDYFSKGNKTFNVIDHSDHSTVLTRTGTHGDFYEYAQGRAEYEASFGTSDSTPVSSYRDVPQGAVAYGRSSNNATEALWTAIVVDKTNHTIHFVRFGAGSDLSVDYTSDTVINVTGITLDQNSASVTEGNTLTLSATLAPSNATNRGVIWSSSDTSVATVSGGVVTAIAEGNCTITATAAADNTVYATCAITVTEIVRTNLLPSAVDTDGSSYNNGTGYMPDVRLHSSGSVFYDSEAIGMYTTGFIPVQYEQTVLLRNIQASTNNDYNYLAFYDSSKEMIANCSQYIKTWKNSYGLNSINEAGGYLTSFKVKADSSHDLSQAAFFRLTAELIDGTSKIYVE